ncbi:bifunctional metallophosphatase/5'-nucleotidase [Natronosalvus halobius]|uniref:bifunctional metallophosphatase/5'-nucleotidase n=1 Tax=Natronosalvus halobius TaxID=2953746 RepID=UPI0020A06324|nr:bifunctional metallophosphatase/5'-nucleotidase [Natronosalvus halobius]USZ73101.1 5'-nucleotidase C-terminal domain-containing protein [Natronosalvus halobius]
MAPRLLHYSDLENAYDDPARLGRLAHLIRERRDDKTLLCDTGDTTAPGLLSMETRGRHVERFYRAVEPDLATFGNHDFDNGRDALESIVANSPQTWLTANLVESTTGERFAADLGVERTAIRSVGGTRIGFVGVTDPETVRTHPCAQSLAVQDPVSAVERAVDVLTDRGAETVVVLSHAGHVDDDIARFEGVDLVLGGHVHDVRAECVDGTLVVHPGQRGGLLAEVRLAPEGPTADIHDVPPAVVATDVADAYRDLRADLGLEQPIAEAQTPIPRTVAECYPESVVGNTVGDAIRWAADADLAVYNAMSLRSGPPLSGAVTVGDLRSTVPFDNEIRTARLDGSEVGTLLESLARPGPDLEVFGHLSGGRVRWRRTERDLEVESVTVDGGSIDSTTTYTVAAPAFAFEHQLFDPLEPDRVVDVHGRCHPALVEYVDRYGLSNVEERMTATVDDAPDSVRSLRE